MDLKWTMKATAFNAIVPLRNGAIWIGFYSGLNSDQLIAVDNGWAIWDVIVDNFVIRSNRFEFQLMKWFCRPKTKLNSIPNAIETPSNSNWKNFSKTSNWFQFDMIAVCMSSVAHCAYSTFWLCHHWFCIKNHQKVLNSNFSIEFHMAKKGKCNFPKRFDCFSKVLSSELDCIVFEIYSAKYGFSLKMNLVVEKPRNLFIIHNSNLMFVCKPRAYGWRLS